MFVTSIRHARPIIISEKCKQIWQSFFKREQRILFSILFCVKPGKYFCLIFGVAKIHEILKRGLPEINIRALHKLAQKI